ncbi:MAG: tRNA pseudouridine(13) synthase TruD [Thermovibrio sp.]|nr:MAG: tRNA pseudouridine(13) synthase TruD [Thermovibrio sp.]
MRELEFKWRRRRPEDFIVNEVSDFEEEREGNFYLYLLAKRNLTTREVCTKLNLSYAGMKDKFALTFQKVSSQKFLGNFYSENFDGERWFKLKFIKRIRRKVKIGQLKGNKFAVNVSGFRVRDIEAFVNYYDTQRIANNWQKGRELLRKLEKSGKRKLSWSENFLLDSYLSYLWNRSLEEFLREKFHGTWVVEDGERFFIPEKLNLSEIPKFWTILGYKKKLLQSEGYYERILREEGWELQSLLELLKRLKIKGDYRMTYVIPRNVRRVGNYIHFFLPKGSFATMFLKHSLEL